MEKDAPLPVGCHYISYLPTDFTLIPPVYRPEESQNTYKKHVSV